MDRNDVPDLLIEQYLLGELPTDRVDEVEQSNGFAERVEALRRSNEEILAEYPPEQFGLRIQNSYEAAKPRAKKGESRSRRSLLRWFSFGVPAVAAAAAAFALILQGVVGGGTVADQTDTDVVRLKGSPEIAIYRAVDVATDRAERLEDGDLAAPGDELQIEYNAGDRLYGMIVSIDGRGYTTLHYPIVPSDGPELTVGSTQQLPVAYVLDDAPDYENFYFIASAEPFSVNQVLEQIRRSARRFVANPEADLGISGDYEVIAFSVRKGE